MSFVTTITSLHIIELSIILHKYLRFPYQHVAGFQIKSFSINVFLNFYTHIDISGLILITFLTVKFTFKFASYMSFFSCILLIFSFIKSKTLKFTSFVLFGTQILPDPSVRLIQLPLHCSYHCNYSWTDNS